MGAVTASLRAILAAAAAGLPPAADGRVQVVPAPTGCVAAIVGFTGHHVIAADVPADWVRTQCPRWAFEAPFGPAFVSAVAQRLAAKPGTLDLVLVADGTRPTGLALEPLAREAAARLLADAPNPRSSTAVYQTPDGRGHLVLGRGLEGRWEVAIEVEPEARGRGVGRGLALAARGMVEPGEPVFAQVAPGNVASVRAALAAGFRPFAAEILFWPVAR